MINNFLNKYKKKTIVHILYKWHRVNDDDSFEKKKKKLLKYYIILPVPTIKSSLSII